MRLIVTGTGRCGTGYMAARLTSAGLPCGHERAINPTTTAKHTGLPPAGLPAESSWLAVPYLAEAREKDIRILLLLRDPEAIVRSLLGIKFFSTDSAYRKYVRANIGWQPSEEPEAAAWRFVEAWVTKALPFADYIASVEAMHDKDGYFERVYRRLLDEDPKPHDPPPKTFNHRDIYRGPIDHDRAVMMRRWFRKLLR